MQNYEHGLNLVAMFIQGEYDGQDFETLACKPVVRVQVFIKYVVGSYINLILCWKQELNVTCGVWSVMSLATACNSKSFFQVNSEITFPHRFLLTTLWSLDQPRAFFSETFWMWQKRHLWKQIFHCHSSLSLGLQPGSRVAA